MACLVVTGNTVARTVVWYCTESDAARKVTDPAGWSLRRKRGWIYRMTERKKEKRSVPVKRGPRTRKNHPRACTVLLLLLLGVKHANTSVRI
jgi:hypothetical protein